LLELSWYSQLIIALAGNTLRGSLATIFYVEDFWSKVEIVGYGVVQKSANINCSAHHLLFSLMFAIGPSFFLYNPTMTNIYALLYFYSSCCLKTDTAMAHPWQQATAVAICFFWSVSLRLWVEVFCFVRPFHFSAVMEHYDGFITDFIEDFMKSIHISEHPHYK